MIYFHTPAARDVVRSYNIEPVEVYTIDGMTVWSADIPEGHPLLKDPAFISHLLNEKLKSGALILSRLRLPLYTVKPYVPHADTLALVLARDKQVLRHMLTNPETNTCPKIILLRSQDMVLDTLRRGNRDQVEYILFFTNTKFAEVMPLKDTMILANMMWRKMHGRDRKPAH